MTSIEKAVERLRNRPGKGAGTGETADRSNVKPIFHLDLDRLEGQGFVTPKSERSQNLKEFQVLKRPLVMNALGRGGHRVPHGNIILVTSPLPGEGKSYISLSLAMSVAMEKDATLLLVDSDVIKPSLTRFLGLDNEPGLTDLLLDAQLNVSDVIIRTDFPKLSILPAGRLHVHSTELLASDYMARIATELSERYANRIVLFDAPPQLATSEASVLAQLAGQVVMVVEEGRTPQRAVKEAIAQIDKNKVIGMVLNKCRQPFGSRYYGYGKDYGYK